ncbi:MAG: hypothetical protein Fur002_09950 [Anaerolineales bacterium]
MNAPRLLEDEVHLWRAPLNLRAERLSRFEKILAPEETLRAQRFSVQRARDEYIAARGFLRAILGAYLQTPPQNVELGYGKYGKPFLKNGKLEFNLAHTAGLALIAVGVGAPLGVDVERARALPEAPDIARRFFSRAEQDIFFASAEKEKTFFELWARKEARLKALGRGLLYKEKEEEIFCVSFTPQERYAAALAVQSETPRRLIFFDAENL